MNLPVNSKVSKAKLLLIQFNEENEKYNCNDCNDLLKYINKNKPNIIIVCSQNSSSSTQNHFQHVFGNQLTNTKYKYSSLYKIDTSKTPLFSGLRMRIYISGFNGEIKILSQEETKDYIVIKILIDGKIYYFINSSNIDNKNLRNLQINKIVYSQRMGFINNEVNNNNNNVAHKKWEEQNFRIYISGLNTKNQDIQKIYKDKRFERSIYNYNLFINNLMNSKILQSGGNPFRTLMNKLKGLPQNNKTCVSNNNKTCVSNNNAEKIGSIMADAQNSPHDSNHVPYYQFMYSLIQSGINPSLFICLFSGAYTDKSFKNAQNYNKTIFISRIDFLNNFIKYLESYDSNRNINIEKINSNKIEAIKKIIENVRNNLINSYDFNYIIHTNLTNNSNLTNNDKYKDHYIKKNKKYLYFMSLLSVVS